MHCLVQLLVQSLDLDTKLQVPTVLGMSEQSILISTVQMSAVID